MDNKKDIFEQFQDHKDQFLKEPNSYLWEMVEEKLDRKKNKRKIRIYKIMAFAAMFIALIAVVAYFNHYLNDHDPDLFASNEGFTAYVLEDLNNDDDDFFNMESFSWIKNAYAEFPNSSQSLDLAGLYEAQDGEIGFEISLKDMKYQLTFDFPGLATFNLNKINGNTLSFESENGYTIRMNLETSGLKLIDSNLFHEYKDFVFRKLTSI